MGVEPVEAMAEEAFKKGIPREKFIIGRGESLPFKDDSFDAVIELGMLHHVERPDIIVREMTRVARKAVFVSDSNRFGQGKLLTRWIKLLLYKCRLWGVVNLIKTGGKGYIFSEKGDGLSYSYSVFDSYHLFAKWADRVMIIPTDLNRGQKPNWTVSRLHPLLTSRAVLLCAIKED